MNIAFALTTKLGQFYTWSLIAENNDIRSPSDEKQAKFKK